MTASGESVQGSRVAVLIPCLNEEVSIGKVVRDFRTELPDAIIIVVDNGSTDATIVEARSAGAKVVRESRRGKGFALLTGVREATLPDVLVMVDGDDTYPAESVHEMLSHVADGADLVVGTRLENASGDAFPVGHSWGNRLFILIVRILFGMRTEDLFSGYRAMTRRFLDESPLIARGFEVEAELSLQALANGFRVAEVPVEYRPRKPDSSSKLKTFRDGYSILIAIVTFFRDYRPLTCFGTLTVVLGTLAALAGFPVVQQYAATGRVLRIPMAILATGLFTLSALSMVAGVLLSAMNRRAEEVRALLLARRQ